MAELKLFGNALIEGVSISGPKGRAAAVRNEDGDIVYRIKKEHRASGGLSRLLRGARELWQGLIWSARQVGDTGDDNLGVFPVIGSVLGSLVLALLVFVFIPVTAAAFAERFLPGPLCSLIEGLLRAVFLALFLLRAGRFNDIKRLKGYNAAAHQAMAAYEANAELSPDSLSRFPVRSRRDGLAVALTAVFFLIIIFAFLNRLDALPRVLIKLALLVLAALIGEAVWRRYCRRPDDGLAKILLAPTVPLQKLLTRRPDPSQQEVAIAALLAVPEIGSVHVDATRRSSLAPTPGSNRAALSSAAAAAAYMEALRRSGNARPATADQLAAYAAAKAATAAPATVAPATVAPEERPVEQAVAAIPPMAEPAAKPIEPAPEIAPKPAPEAPAAEAVAAAAAAAASQRPSQGKSKHKKRFGFFNRDSKPAAPKEPEPVPLEEAEAAAPPEPEEPEPPQPEQRETTAAHLMDAALADLLEGPEAEVARAVDAADAAEMAANDMEQAAEAAATIAAAFAAAEKAGETETAAFAAAEEQPSLTDEFAEAAAEIEKAVAQQAAEDAPVLSAEAEEAAADWEETGESNASKLGRKTAAMASAAAAAIISGSRELGQSANRLADAVTRGIKPGHKEQAEEAAAELLDEKAAEPMEADAPVEEILTEAGADEIENMTPEVAVDLAEAAAPAAEVPAEDAELNEIEAKAAAQAEALAKAQAEAEAEAEAARAAARAEATARRKARSEAEARAAAKARAREEEKAREEAEAAARAEEKDRAETEAAEEAAKAEAEKLRRADAEALARSQAEAEQTLFREPEAPAPAVEEEAAPAAPARPPKKARHARGYRNDSGRYVERRPRPSQESANRMQRLARNIGLKVDRIYGDVEYYDPEDADQD